MSTTIQTQETAAYAVDRAHSAVEFAVRHLMISKVRGRFAQFEGQITLDPGGDLPVAVNAAIDAASVDTGEEQRDAHLRSADFLETEKYPRITFASTRIEGSPDDFTIYGDLTIHGVTRRVALKANFEGSGSDPWGGQRIAYGAHTTISRKDFGLTWNAALETGGVVIGDDVRIELSVEALRQ
jgi:polyisoprenoid-binding protein YceI